MFTLHKHQAEALASIEDAITRGNGKVTGRVVMPTGAGKTFIEALVIDYQRLNNTNMRIHLVDRKSTRLNSSHT